MGEPPRKDTYLSINGDHFDKALGLVLDRQDSIEASFITFKDELPTAMATAIEAVVTNEEVIERMMDIMLETAQKQAAIRTGNAVGSLIKTILSKYLIIGFLVFLAIKALGIDLVLKLWATIKGG